MPSFQIGSLVVRWRGRSCSRPCTSANLVLRPTRHARGRGPMLFMAAPELEHCLSNSDLTPWPITQTLRLVSRLPSRKDSVRWAGPQSMTTSGSHHEVMAQSDSLAHRRHPSPRRRSRVSSFSVDADKPEFISAHMQPSSSTARVTIHKIGRAHV